MLASARRHLLVALLSAAAVVAVVADLTSAAPDASPPPGSPAIELAAAEAHPFSDPVWYPIRDVVYLDCVFHNPGCDEHDGWTTDMVLETLGTHPNPHPGVYAMGGGILHVGNAHGAACGTGVHDFGTWVWIDHGYGTVSRYGHLASIAVADGSVVRAGQRIGQMGATGKNENCKAPYLNFQVRRGGIQGTRIRVPRLKVCDHKHPTEVTSWPDGLVATEHWRPRRPIFAKPSQPTTYTNWNQVPKRSVDFPATTSACLPRGAPATPAQPTGVKVKRRGAQALRVSWPAPPASPRTTTVRIELSMYRTSAHRWDLAQRVTYLTLPARSRSHTFTKLVGGRMYRARVSFRNRVGNSAPTTWIRRAPNR